MCEKQIATIPLDEYTLEPEVYLPSSDCIQFAAANPSGYAVIDGKSVRVSETYPMHWCSCARPCGPYVNSTVSYLVITRINLK